MPRTWCRVSGFTAEQRAELRDAAARSRVEAQAEHRRLARLAQQRKAAERADARLLAPPGRRRRKSVALAPPKTATLPPPTLAERDLADRLLPHLCRESVVDRDRHALCVARAVLHARRCATPTFTEEGTT